MQRVWVNSNEGYLPCIKEDDEIFISLEDDKILLNEDILPNQSYPPVAYDKLPLSSLPYSEDILHLKDLSKFGVYYHLKLRYQSHLNNTWLGNKYLISFINPSQALFTNSTFDIVNKSESIPEFDFVNSSNDPAHIFSIGKRSLNLLKNSSDEKGESIVLLGEKEACSSSKNMLIKYLFETSESESALERANRSSSFSSESELIFTSKLSKMLLSIGRLIESFASISNNNNGITNTTISKFGSIVKIMYNNQMKPESANLYLRMFERQRVYQQPKDSGVNNFNIFYYLTRGTTKDEKRALCLLDVEHFKILNNTNNNNTSVIDFEKHYNFFVEDLYTLELKDETIADILKLLSVILHIGNVEFEAQGDSCMVSDTSFGSLIAAANLLQTDTEQIELILCFNEGKSNEVTKHNAIEANIKRDACISLLYDGIISFLLNHVNNSTAVPSESEAAPEIKQLSIIDMAGCLAEEGINGNSSNFQELCQNYANDKLIQYFTKTTVSSFQNFLDDDPNIDIPLDFHFNCKDSVVDLLENNTFGVLFLLESEVKASWKRNNNITDIKMIKNEEILVNLLNNAHGGDESCNELPHPNYFVIKNDSSVSAQLASPSSSVSFANKMFGVKHYEQLCNVSYNVRDFNTVNSIEKNGYPVLQRLNSHSTNELLFAITKLKEPTTRLSAALPPLSSSSSVSSLEKTSQPIASLSKNIVNEMNKVVKLIQDSRSPPQFVFSFAVSNNDTKRNDNNTDEEMKWDGNYVFEQLKCSGVFAAAEKEENFYSISLSFDDFISSYKVCVPELIDKWSQDSSPTSSTLSEEKKCILILQSLLVEEKWGNCYILGNSHIHLKRKVMLVLHKIKEKSKVIYNAVVFLQSIYRGFVQRRSFKKKMAERRRWNIERLLALKNRIDSYEKLQEMLKLSLKNLDFPSISQLLEKIKPLQVKSKEVVLAQEIFKERESSLSNNSNVLSLETVMQNVISEGAIPSLENLEKLEKCLEKDRESPIEIISSGWRLLSKGHKHLAILERFTSNSRLSGSNSNLSSNTTKALHLKNAKALSIVVEDLFATSATLSSYPQITDLLKRFTEASGMISALHEAVDSNCYEDIKSILHDMEPLKIKDELEKDGKDYKMLVQAQLNINGMDANAFYQHAVTQAMETNDMDLLTKVLASAGTKRQKLWEDSGILTKLVIKREENSPLSKTEIPGNTISPLAIRSITRKEKDNKIEKIENLLMRGLRMAKGKSLKRNEIPSNNNSYNNNNESELQEIENNRKSKKINAAAWTTLPCLRTPGNYAKRHYLGKDKLKDSMFIWTKDPIPRSLKEFKSKEEIKTSAGISITLNQLSLNMFKNIQMAMGDIPSTFPVTLAHEVLVCGFEVPAIRDEIYFQFFKQLSNNPSLPSLIKGWTLLLLVTKSFPPSNLLLESTTDFFLSAQVNGGKIEDNNNNNNNNNEIIKELSVQCDVALKRCLRVGMSHDPPPLQTVSMAMSIEEEIKVSFYTCDAVQHTVTLAKKANIVVNDVMNAVILQLTMNGQDGATFALYLSDCSMKEGICEVFSEKCLSNDEPIDRILVQIEGSGVGSKKLLFKKRFFVGDNKSIAKTPFVQSLIQAQLAGDFRSSKLPLTDKNGCSELWGYQMIIRHGSLSETLKALNPKFRQFKFFIERYMPLEFRSKPDSFYIDSPTLMIKNLEKEALDNTALKNKVTELYLNCLEKNCVLFGCTLIQVTKMTTGDGSKSIDGVLWCTISQAGIQFLNKSFVEVVPGCSIELTKELRLVNKNLNIGIGNASDQTSKSYVIECERASELQESLLLYYSAKMMSKAREQAVDKPRGKKKKRRTTEVIDHHADSFTAPPPPILPPPTIEEELPPPPSSNTEAILLPPPPPMVEEEITLAELPTDKATEEGKIVESFPISTTSVEKMKDIKFNAFPNSNKDGGSGRGRSQTVGEKLKRSGSMIDMYILPSLEPSNFAHSIGVKNFEPSTTLFKPRIKREENDDNKKKQEVKTNAKVALKKVSINEDESDIIRSAAPRRALLINAKLSLRKVEIVKKVEARDSLLSGIKAFTKVNLRPASEREQVKGHQRQPSAEVDLLGMIKNTMNSRRDKLAGSTGGEIVSGFSTNNSKMNSMLQRAAMMFGGIKEEESEDEYESD